MSLSRSASENVNRWNRTQRMAYLSVRLCVENGSHKVCLFARSVGLSIADRVFGSAVVVFQHATIGEWSSLLVFVVPLPDALLRQMFCVRAAGSSRMTSLRMRNPLMRNLQMMHCRLGLRA